MIRKLTVFTGATVLAAAAAISGPVAQATDADRADRTPGSAVAAHTDAAVSATSVDHLDAEPITKAEFEKLAAQQAGKPVSPMGWDVPWPMSYTITASCAGDAASIRQGAAAWNQLTEGGGTPVECRTDYITDCGGGAYVVGCNWGQGQRIALFPGGVNDDALLAAHEFGHDWYGHSSYQCAGWGSPAEVMAPAICNLTGTAGRM